MKTCNTCNIEKELGHFYKSPSYKDGLCNKCKDCTKLYDQQLKAKIREIPETKFCSYCQIVKSSSEFHKKSKNSDGLRSECKECTRNQEKKYRVENYDVGYFNKIKNRYGLTEVEFLSMMESQDGKCEICNKQSKLVIDHNHTTNKVRALLCQNCNAGLGMFLENLDILKSAMDYIKRYNDETMVAAPLPQPL